MPSVCTSGLKPVWETRRPRVMCALGCSRNPLQSSSTRRLHQNTLRCGIPWTLTCSAVTSSLLRRQALVSLMSSQPEGQVLHSQIGSSSSRHLLMMGQLSSHVQTCRQTVSRRLNSSHWC